MWGRQNNDPLKDVQVLKPKTCDCVTYLIHQKRYDCYCDA